jgi:hypothetical protein
MCTVSDWRLGPWVHGPSDGTISVAHPTPKE